MSSHDKEQSHCDAYEKILDLDLFNALLALVVKMSDNKDAMLEYSRFISQKSLWASRCNDPGAYFAQHELRYIGEITERFEERIGSSWLLDLPCHFSQTPCLLGLSEKTSYVGWIKRLGTTCICREPATS